MRSLHGRESILSSGRRSRKPMAHRRPERLSNEDWPNVRRVRAERLRQATLLGRSLVLALRKGPPHVSSSFLSRVVRYDTIGPNVPRCVHGFQERAGGGQRAAPSNMPPALSIAVVEPMPTDEHSDLASRSSLQRVRRMGRAVIVGESQGAGTHSPGNQASGETNEKNDASAG